MIMEKRFFKFDNRNSIAMNKNELQTLNNLPLVVNEGQLRKIFCTSKTCLFNLMNNNKLQTIATFSLQMRAKQTKKIDPEIWISRFFLYRFA